MKSYNERNSTCEWNLRFEEWEEKVLYCFG